MSADKIVVPSLVGRLLAALAIFTIAVALGYNLRAQFPLPAPVPQPARVQRIDVQFVSPDVVEVSMFNCVANVNLRKRTAYTYCLEKE